MAGANFRPTHAPLLLRQVLRAGLLPHRDDCRSHPQNRCENLRPARAEVFPTRERRWSAPATLRDFRGAVFQAIWRIAALQPLVCRILARTPLSAAPLREQT